MSMAYGQKTLMNTLRRYGGEGARTPDLRLAKPALCQLSYAPSVSIFKLQISNLKFERVGLSRFELLTSRLSGVRSNQLSYRPCGSLLPQNKATWFVSQVAL